MALPRNISNHNPMVLEFNRPFGGPVLFKCEEMWFLEPYFLEVAEREWNQVAYFGNLSRTFALKLKALKCFLRMWKKNLGCSLKASMEMCCKRVKQLDLV